MAQCDQEGLLEGEGALMAGQNPLGKMAAAKAKGSPRGLGNSCIWQGQKPERSGKR